ncbi:hypothetical protein SAMN05443247_06622 [Bradyrhizobium erythrophlei]|jgi:hypothetical protein|nr:hypothetical protein SAMN05443247_06622 [Bradyrhizobium erythrophlei]
MTEAETIRARLAELQRMLATLKAIRQHLAEIRKGS